MTILLLSLLGLSGATVIYGLVRVSILFREYCYRRRVFEHHQDGRKTERRDSDRQSTRILGYAWR